MDLCSALRPEHAVVATHTHHGGMMAAPGKGPDRHRRTLLGQVDERSRQLGGLLRHPPQQPLPGASHHHIGGSTLVQQVGEVNGDAGRDQRVKLLHLPDRSRATPLLSLLFHTIL